MSSGCQLNLGPYMSSPHINCKAENITLGSENCLHLDTYMSHSFHCSSMLNRAGHLSGLTAIRSWHKIRLMQLYITRSISDRLFLITSPICAKCNWPQIVLARGRNKTYPIQLTLAINQILLTHTVPQSAPDITNKSVCISHKCLHYFIPIPYVQG